MYLVIVKGRHKKITSPVCSFLLWNNHPTPPSSWRGPLIPPRDHQYYGRNLFIIVADKAKSEENEMEEDYTRETNSDCVELRHLVSLPANPRSRDPAIPLSRESVRLPLRAAPYLLAAAKLDWIRGWENSTFILTSRLFNLIDTAQHSMRLLRCI